MNQLSTNYRISRFCNYIILNFSEKCKYLQEIGIQINNKILTITVRTDINHQHIFQAEWKQFLKNTTLGREYLLITNIGYEFQIELVTQKFSEKFIKEQSQYYFKPDKAKGKYIFKYSSFNKNTITALINNTLWFSDPGSFNDPFDCRYTIDADPQDHEIFDFYYNQSKNKNLNLTKEDFISNYQAPLKSKFLNDLEEYHFQNSFQTQGICCFSEIHNNRLMWAHYADNVKGICLVFDTSIEVNDDYFKFSKSKVKYRGGLIRKFYDGSKYFEVTDILYTKNKMWKYEYEIRERMPFEKGNSNRSVHFDPRTLVGIILGPKMPESDKQTIKNLIDQLTKYKIEIIDSYVDISNNTIRLKSNILKIK
ncbi:DUF2971 domain-containing protein [Sphingobacterium faecium]|uniref:DUF2971 domain-containing protein n=1 Tax=Sphingobacterium faecium TaxID=34087 RepID=UPI003DA4B82E